jgi:type IV pilus assembly protein PilC
MKLSLEENYIFCHEMAMILDAGFSISQGLDMIYDECEDNHLKLAIEKVISSFQENYQLSESIKDTKMFDSYMCHLVEVGELNGNMDDIMNSLADYYQNMDHMLFQLKQAFTYPIFLLCMMFVVIGVIAFKVLPIFDEVLRSLGTKLSTYAYTFMSIGQTLSLIAFIIIGVIVIVMIGAYSYSRFSQTLLIQLFLNKSIITRKLSYLLSTAQMTYAFSLFVSSGYDMSEAIRYVVQFIEHPGLHKKLILCEQDLKNNLSFEEVVKKHHLYHGMSLNMIQVGSKTGQIDQVMKDLAVYYQEESSSSIQNFINTIEPSIVIILSVIVGIVLLSVMLPLMSIMSAL